MQGHHGQSDLEKLSLISIEDIFRALKIALYIIDLFNNIFAICNILDKLVSDPTDSCVIRPMLTFHSMRDVL